MVDWEVSRGGESRESGAFHPKHSVQRGVGDNGARLIRLMNTCRCADYRVLITREIWSSATHGPRTNKQTNGGRVLRLLHAINPFRDGFRGEEGGFFLNNISSGNDPSFLGDISTRWHGIAYDCCVAIHDGWSMLSFSTMGLTFRRDW